MENTKILEGKRDEAESHAKLSKISKSQDKEIKWSCTFCDKHHRPRGAWGTSEAN